jgi:hypothetical protein
VKDSPQTCGACGQVGKLGTDFTASTTVLNS